MPIPKARSSSRLHIVVILQRTSPGLPWRCCEGEGSPGGVVVLSSPMKAGIDAPGPLIYLRHWNRANGSRVQNLGRICDVPGLLRPTVDWSGPYSGS